MEWSGLWHDEYALHWSNWLAVRRGCTRDHEHQHANPAETCRRHRTRAAELVRLYNRELHYERMFVVHPIPPIGTIGSRGRGGGQQGEERARVPPARTDSRGSTGDHARRRGTAQLAGDASLRARAMANLAPALRKSKARLTARDEPAATRLGALLVAAGRYTDAADVLALASEVDPMSPGPLYELGNLQVRNVNV